MSYQVGIDLGTTYTAAAVHRDGKAQIFSLGGRAASIPSVVLLREDETILTGEAAVRRAITEPERVAREFKRRLGDTTPIIVGGSPYSAEALMARLLKSVVEQVVTREDAEPTRIAISHPANWGPYKLDLFGQAIRLAGLPDNVITLTEPEAAAISYANQERVEEGQVVAVFDLGGGTFDACLLRRTEEGFEIIGKPEGIERLGGIDFDAAVFAHVARSLDGALGELDAEDPAAQAAVARLRADCVDAKEALSSDTDATIPVLLPNLQTEVRITRREFESLVRPSLADSLDSMRRAVDSAGVQLDEVAKVLLVGGSSRIPLVGQMVASELGRPVAVDAHPKHAIAIGAAYRAGAASGDAQGPSGKAAAPVTPATSAPAGGAAAAAAAAVAPTQAPVPPTPQPAPVPDLTPRPAPEPVAKPAPSPAPTPAPKAAPTPKPAPAPELKPDPPPGPKPAPKTPPTPAVSEPAASSSEWAAPTAGSMSGGSGAGGGATPPTGSSDRGGSKLPMLIGGGVAALLLLVGGYFLFSGGDDGGETAADETTTTTADSAETTVPDDGSPNGEVDDETTTTGAPAGGGDAEAETAATLLLSDLGLSDELAVTVTDGTAAPVGTVGTTLSGELQPALTAIEGIDAIDPAGLTVVADDEWCSPAVKANSRWVCITSATWNGSAVEAQYETETGGADFSFNGGFHYHFFSDDTEPITAGQINGVSEDGGVWEVWEDPDGYTSTIFATKPDRLCVRVATDGHGLDSLEGGNCWPVTDG